MNNRASIFVRGRMLRKLKNNYLSLLATKDIMDELIKKRAKLIQEKAELLDELGLGLGAYNINLLTGEIVKEGEDDAG